MSKSDDFRSQAKKARSVAETVDRHEIRRAALDIAEGWDRLADQAEDKPEKQEKSGS